MNKEGHSNLRVEIKIDLLRRILIRELRLIELNRSFYTS